MTPYNVGLPQSYAHYSTEHVDSIFRETISIDDAVRLDFRLVGYQCLMLGSKISGNCEGCGALNSQYHDPHNAKNHPINSEDDSILPGLELFNGLGRPGI